MLTKAYFVPSGNGLGAGTAAGATGYWAGAAGAGAGWPGAGACPCGAGACWAGACAKTGAAVSITLSTRASTKRFITVSPFVGGGKS